MPFRKPVIGFLFLNCWALPSTAQDTAIAHVRGSADGQSNLSYPVIQQLASDLGLDSLPLGFDSLQIRVWYDPAQILGKRVIVIKRHGGQWIANFHDVVEQQDPIFMTTTVQLSKMKALEPHRGWPKLMARLNELKIAELPDMRSIPGLVDRYKEGWTYHIEVVDAHQHRFISYHLPEEFADAHWQAQNVVAIVKTLEEEFDIVLGR